MRLYFKKLPSNINDDNLETYKRYNYTERLLFSYEGIFKINNNNIQKLVINDCEKDVEEYNINSTDFMLDLSNNEFIEGNKLPYSHKCIDKEITIYSLYNKSKTKLQIERIDKRISDIFITIDERPTQKFIIEDISTLVSLLN
tara:strand:+ start:468 stop:896 length:429 start_codon:yes stop_codon:yes gene_type:complete